MRKKIAIIIGAGPAGLTAAYELLQRTSIQPIIVEAENMVGGIAKTINYKGNRIDIGGHRFFSKVKRINSFWQSILPLGLDPETTDLVMLERQRVSRILYLRQFFDYPLKLNIRTLKQLGLIRVWKIICSYIAARIFPIKNEQSLKDFFINRFGRELYQTFFRDYTEKVWGVSCDKIGVEWGSQRIKGLSVTKTIVHALKKFFGSVILQQNAETSLIDHFWYPKYGPGQFWEELAKIIQHQGGIIHTNSKVVNIENSDTAILSVDVLQHGTISTFTGDYFFSTMPIKDLIAGCKNPVPQAVVKVASGLIYRDFITVGLLLRELKIKNTPANKAEVDLIPDNWIYVQESDVKLGRIQVFNNWSPYLLKDKNSVWLGLEYFCNENDAFWNMHDQQLINHAINELETIGVIDKKMVLDSVLIRVAKTYPAYFGSYSEFDQIRNYTDNLANLFLIGRNGMHRYNNMDHSMLTAMVAVDNIVNNISGKENIWAVNTEDEYHEAK